MKRWILLLALLAFHAQAEDLLMVRSAQSFPETMLLLQQTIADKGYTLSRVQRVDVGLTKMGYKTDKYRVVFLGKPEEIRRLKRDYPELIPYLPLKISIFAENEQTLLSTVNPEFLGKFYKQPELQATFRRWATDLHEILETVRTRGNR